MNQAAKLARRNYLSQRAFGALILVQLLSAVAVVMPALLPIYLLALILLVLLLIFDRFSCRYASVLEPSLAVASRLTLELKAGAQIFVPIELRDFRVISFVGSRLDVIKSNQLRRSSAADQSRVFLAELDVFPRSLGVEEISALELSWRSRLGFWKRVEVRNLATPQKVRVVPAEDRVSEHALRELIALPTVSPFLRAQRTRTRSGDLYYTSRRFQFGDELRHLDVRKSAKFGAPFMRTYERSSELHLVVALDMGRGMRGEVRKSRKLDFYLSVADSLVADALGGGDCVSFVGFADKPITLVQKSHSIGQVRAAIDRVAAIEAIGAESDYANAARFIAQVAGSRSLIVILGDAARPGVRAGLLPTLNLLSKRHVVSALALIEEEYDLDACLEQLDSLDEARLMHAYLVRDGWDGFSERVRRLGGVAALVRERYWLAASRLLYRDLRDRVHRA